MPAHTAGQVIVATGTDNEVTAVDPSTLTVGIPTVDANSLYGNNTGSAAPGISLSAAQALALLSIPASPVTVLLQSGIPFVVPPSGNMANNGVLRIGSTPASSATASFSAASGSGVTMTMSAASLLGTSADVGRVLTIIDTTYKYATITAFTSTTVATVTLTGTLSGTGPFANANIWLTASTPLPTTYPAAYVYMPANAISAGSGAGWYYAVMTSSTVGTLYNNTYTSGTPTIPGSPTAFSTTGPGAYTQSTSNIAGPSVTVPANSLGLNGSLEFFLLLSSSTTANSRRGGYDFGGSAVFDMLMNATSELYDVNIGSVRNNGVANSQVGARQSSGDDAGDATKSFASPLTRTSVNTAADQTCAMRLSISVATDWVVAESYSIRAVV